MTRPVRILMAEDRLADAQLAQREIRRALARCEFELVETREGYLAALTAFQPDLIISDYRMPRFDGLTALELAIEHAPQTPVIILTGAINEDTAVQCMKAGAADYVIKEHLKRLGQAVSHALEQRQLRLERQQAEQALRASEERYRILAQTLPDALTVIDADGAITYASPPALRLYGHATEQEVLGRAVAEWVHSDYRQQTLDHIRLVQAGTPIASKEYLLLKSDGSTFFGEVSASCIYGPQRQVTGYIVIVRDVTPRKQAEAAQAQLEAQLRHSQKMESIGRLASGVAHDFNNLLTVIQGYCDTIQDQLPSDDPIFDDIEQIRRASERATKLTRQLLAFSRRQVLSPARLDLNSLVAELQAMLVRLIGPGIALTTALDPDLRIVIADPGQIGQVIMNLVVNARDAMPDGGALTLMTRNVAPAQYQAPQLTQLPSGGYVQLAVADTGCGMDAETLSRIFEPFFTTKTPDKGTGLGLATVYGIIKQSGGEITVTSAPNQGTTFTIYLPVADLP